MFANFARAAGLAEAWFFVRYADPYPHLRLRFRGDPAVLTERLMPEVTRWAGTLIRDTLCERFAFETYEREVERYGGDEGMTVAEEIFAVDSDTAAQLLWAPERVSGSRPHHGRGHGHGHTARCVTAPDRGAPGPVRAARRRRLS